MRGFLVGRRLEYLEVAELLYAAGWRRRNLTVMVAIVDWESARFEGAYLDYEDPENPGAKDYGLLQINWTFKPAYQSWGEWEHVVFNAAKNVDLARQIFDTARRRGGTGFEPWVAWSNGNFQRSMSAARHWTAQVDPSFFPRRSFRWWGLRWIPGTYDRFVLEARRHGLGEKRVRRWEALHPDLESVLRGTDVTPAEFADELIPE